MLEKLLREKPILRPAYEFKEELCGLLRLSGQTKALCRAHIRKLRGLMKQMEDDSNKHFKALHKTMRRWYKPIIRMWRYSLHHGITEGLHRKMKLIQRRMYSFHNFVNYRLRVPVECSGGGDGASKTGFHTRCA